MKILLSIFSLAVMLVPLSNQAEATKPNVVFIFVDDQGYYDLGCYGATEVKTPRAW